MIVLTLAVVSTAHPVRSQEAAAATQEADPDLPLDEAPASASTLATRCEEDDAGSCFELSNRYREGRDVARDLVRAVNAGIKWGQAPV